MWWNDSNWWLVIVGAFTGAVISWQAWETRKTAEVAKRSTEAALAQISMVKVKERARVRVELADLKLAVTPRKHQAIHVDWRVLLDGQTEALIKESQCFAGIEDDETITAIKRAWGEMAELPPVISLGQRKIEGTVLVRPGKKFGYDYEAISENLRTKSIHIVCSGFVQFDDVFGGRWIFRFKRRWGYFGQADSILPNNLLSGEWAECGNPNENGEYPFITSAHFSESQRRM